MQKLEIFNEVNFVESSQLRRISIIGISILCLSPVEFFSNQLFENRKVETTQVVMSSNEMKFEPNYLSSNYEIFNPNITATSEEITTLVSENKKKEITESENKLESETANEENVEEYEEVVEEVYEETSSSTTYQEVYEYTEPATVNVVEEPVYVAPQPNTDVATSLVNFALQFVGYSYVPNGADLYNGVDCSGFTMKVYEQFGYSLPHNAASQSSYGSYVSLDQLAPGDLIFYGYGGSICHVAIYIGNGQIVHAATSSQGIVTAGYQIMPIITARRILN